MGKPLAVVYYNCAAFLLFFPMVGKLHRFSMCNVQEFVFSEHSIQHSGSAEQAYVFSMQRSQWPSAAHVSLLSDQHSRSLPVSRRFEQSVFNQVKGKAGIGEQNGS